jgi:hypothetical protein
MPEPKPAFYLFCGNHLLVRNFGLCLHDGFSSGSPSARYLLPCSSKGLQRWLDILVAHFPVRPVEPHHLQRVVAVCWSAVARRGAQFGHSAAARQVPPSVGDIDGSEA